jgi:hypothetical protein
VHDFLLAWFRYRISNESRAAANAALYGKDGDALYEESEGDLQKLYGNALGSLLYWDVQNGRYGWARFLYACFYA